jgi:hypothetical protein
MKFIRPQHKAGSRAHAFAFHLSQREKELLLATLKFYPQLEPRYHQLSRDAKTAGKGEQEWLEETMLQQQKEHQKKLAQFFEGERRFFKGAEGELCLTLTGEQMEWLLRVLNEVRVGAWVKLGRPEMETARRLHLSGAKAQLFTAMDLSGYFQMCLLEACG